MSVTVASGYFVVSGITGSVVALVVGLTTTSAGCVLLVESTTTDEFCVVASVVTGLTTISELTISVFC